MAYALLVIIWLIPAAIVHAFYAITLSYWQRKAMLYAINEKDPLEAIRKLDILRGIDFSTHVNRVTFFRDPWVLYADLPDEVRKMR